MKSVEKWKDIIGVHVLKSCLVFVWLIQVHANPNQKVASRNEVTDRSAGFISIDCGANSEYIDETNGFWYETDDNYIQSGSNYEVFPEQSIFNGLPIVSGQLKTLRNFPEGEKNCYTLNATKGKNQTYLIRASFAYGNYDNKNDAPVFDLYLGVNFWTKVQWRNASFYMLYDIIQHVSTDTIQVCLVNTGQGIPFINTLELRPINNSLYSSSLPLSCMTRYDLGYYYLTLSRYKNDMYDRWWITPNYAGYWDPLEINTTEEIRVVESAYKLPLEVLRTVVQPHNITYNLTINWTYDESYQYIVFLHFAEIQKLPPGHKRIINVTFGDNHYFSQPLDYLKPITLTNKNPTKGRATFNVTESAQSNAPPILNAFEIYQLVPQPNNPTNAQDVYAINEIKRTYGVSRISWQGDPCVPSNFTWEGLNCSSDNNSRIISLNLSSSKLTGQIAPQFGNLERLEFLDLSSNELTGHVPEFIANLRNLKFLNLSGNKLTGLIPKALREKADLQLSAANNPDLCQNDSCKEVKEHKIVIPLIASIAILVLIVLVSLMIWRLRKKISGLPIKSQNTSILKQKNQAFSHSQVLRITNNFETILGEGGFGKVYLGTLEDDTQVAVKLLSPSSKQGYKEFQSEAQLLTVIHHRNLVSLIGYCHEDDFKALIYEYMDNGDLSRLLSEKNPNVLKWNERLQVAVDAAKGLEYLHNGCRTPIIHRDLKPSNILLNKSMLAKIADFGLSKAFMNDKDSHLSTQPAGTPGYIDPAFQRSGNLNKKSDIYSFGMILLQLITGRPPIRKENDNISFILDWVRPKIECGDIQSIVDPRVAGEFGVVSAWKVVEIAMSCISPEPSERPDISNLLQELKDCLALEKDALGSDRSEPHGSLNYESMSVLSAR